MSLFLTSKFGEMKTASKSPPPFWIYGIHAVRMALSNPRREVLEILALPGVVLPELEHRTFRLVDKGLFLKILGPDAVHQGIAARVMPLRMLHLEEFLKTRSAPSPLKLVLLDQVTDPHNFGAILRSAAALGAQAVGTTDRHSAAESSILAKAASGALDVLPLIKLDNLAQAIELLKKENVWVVGLDERGTTRLSDFDPPDRLAFIMGSEGEGLRELTKKRVDLLLHIATNPAFPTLNVSAAAAVALSKFNWLGS